MPIMVIASSHMFENVSCLAVHAVLEGGGTQIGARDDSHRCKLPQHSMGDNDEASASVTCQRESQTVAHQE
eukprot:794792-Prymnesium_polylepis.1